MMGWYGGGGGMGWASWLLMGTFWVLLLGLIVWLVVRLLPSADRRGAEPRTDSPEDILDRRFALGEIDEQTYNTQRAALATHRRTGR